MAHSVKELKAAATSLEVDIAGCFEKDELVKAFKLANVSSDQVKEKESGGRGLAGEGREGRLHHG